LGKLVGKGKDNDEGGKKTKKKRLFSTTSGLTTVFFCLHR